MKIKKLRLVNFRAAGDISLDFTDGINLFAGFNGAGKSTILDAVSINLSWLFRRIDRKKPPAYTFLMEDLKKNQNNGSLELCLEWGGVSYNFLQKCTVEHGYSKTKFNHDDFRNLSEKIRAGYEQNKSAPVFAYYRVNRNVGAIKPEVSRNQQNGNVAIYDDALSSKIDYQSFFRWFREQDDIKNEELSLHQKWLKSNENWFRKRIGEIFVLIEKAFFKNSDGSRIQKFQEIKNDLEKKVIGDSEKPPTLVTMILPVISCLHDRSEIEKFNCFVRLVMRIDLFNTDCQDREQFFEKYGSVSGVVQQILRRLEEYAEPGLDDDTFCFFWESMILSVSLNFWWCSDEGRNELEKIFRKFKPPKTENGYIIFPLDSDKEKFLASLEKVLSREIEAIKIAGQNNIRFVTRVIENFVPEFSNFRVERLPYPRLLVDKCGVSFDLAELSDGEKNLIALIGDIARRFVTSYSEMENPLHGKGVILIDEIDLHLHPKWQRMVVPGLQVAFPNCQFFISTHSPQVISHVKAENVFILHNDKESGMYYEKVKESYGMSVERVVELLMDDESRPPEVTEKLDILFELIERNKLDEAKKLVAEMKEYLSSDPEIIRAETRIRMEERKK